jgi:hypothetical protein
MIVLTEIFIDLNLKVISFNEESRGDTIFSSVGNRFIQDGSIMGTRCANTYVAHLERYEASKLFKLAATEKERNFIRCFSDKLCAKAFRYRINWAVKAGIGAMFIYNLSKASETKDVLAIRRKLKCFDWAGIYYNTFTSGLLFGLVFLAI